MSDAMAGADSFRFDAEESDEDFDADRSDLQADGMHVEGMHADWWEFSEGHVEDSVSGEALGSAGLGLTVESGLREDPATAPSVLDEPSEQWQVRAEAAAVSKESRDVLARLAAVPESEHFPALRDRLKKRVDDADAFGVRALAAMRQRPPLEELQLLLTDGLSLRVETRELLRVQQCVRQAQELQNRLAAFDYCEEQLDLRGLKSILNEMERLPVVLNEEASVRERWSQSNAWLDRAKAILSSPRRTRQGKQGLAGYCARQRFTLNDVESLVQESNQLPLICKRPEARDLAEMVDNFIAWRDEVRMELATDPIQLDEQPPETREAFLTSLVTRGSDFPIDNEESIGLVLRLWMCRAQKATSSKTSLKDLIDLCEKSVTADAPEDLMTKVQEKRRLAEEWVTRAKGALSKKWRIADCRALLQEAEVLEVDSEECFLIEYQVEAAESWSTRVQAQLALSLNDADYKVLKALLKESDRIAVRLDKVAEIERRMDELERKEQEESECEWAQCDGCNKWRRLGKGQQVAETDKFFCQNVAKTCDDVEDDWDESKEEITRYDGGSDGSDADDDVSLADRKLMIPGALVYAQHEYYPFWPAQVKDPDADHITAEVLKVRRHGCLLVQFLGKSMGTGLRWVDRRKLVPFTPNADPNDKPGMRPIRSQDYKVAVQSACDMVKRKEEKASKREREGEGGSESSSASENSGDSSSEDSDSSGVEVIDYGEEYKSRQRSSGVSKRRRRKSEGSKPPGSGGSSSRSKSLDKSKRKRAKLQEKTGMKVNGAVVTVQPKEGKSGKPDAKQQPGGKRDSAAAASASAPLFPKWFMQLPISWQGSYTTYTAISDAEQKLKERLASLTAPEDIRREVRNMVFCAFISAVALEIPATVRDQMGSAGGGTASSSASPSQAAQNLENALFVACGSTITADYRRKYRLLAMALRCCPNVRAALLRATLTPAVLIGMSGESLEAYGKSTSSAAKKAGAALPLPATAASSVKAKRQKLGEGEVKIEGVQAASCAVPEPPRVVKVTPAKVASFLPVVKTKIERPSRTPSPEREADGSGGEGGGDMQRAQQRSPTGDTARGRNREGGELTASDTKKPAVEGVEPAAVGEIGWIGSIRKAESQTQVRVKAVALDGARLRAVGRVPSTLKIVGRLAPENLAKFLADLSRSRSRHKTVVRFELEGNSMHKSVDPAAVKAYNRLVEEYDSKSKVGVINLPGQNEQVYIAGPTAARLVLGLDAPGNVLYGVFIMRVGHGGEYWSQVHARPPPASVPVSESVAPAARPARVRFAAAGGTDKANQRAAHVAEMPVECASGNEVKGVVTEPVAAAAPIAPPAACTSETAPAAACASGTTHDGDPDVMNAFESIKALLRASDGSAITPSTAPASAPSSSGLPREGAAAPPMLHPHSVVHGLPARREEGPPTSHALGHGNSGAGTGAGAGAGAGVRAALPPPSTPHPSTIQHPPITHVLPPRHSQPLPVARAAMLPPPAAPPPVHHHGYGGPGAAPAHGPAPQLPAHVPPPATGQFNDPDHARNLQQLQNLSTEHLISLLISQRP